MIIRYVMNELFLLFNVKGTKNNLEILHEKYKSYWLKPYCITVISTVYFLLNF